MFFCCGGGSRQIKTREDFVTAAAGFDNGRTTVDERIREDERAERPSSRAESSGKRSSDRRSDENATHIEDVEQVPWSPTQGLKKSLQYKENTDASHQAEDTSPLPPPPKTPYLTPKMSELTKPMSTPRRHEQLGDFYVDEPASIRPGWSNARTTRNGTRLPRDVDVDDAASVPPRCVKELSQFESANRFDVIRRSERPVWQDDQSEQAGSMYDTDSVAAESVRPTWLHVASSVITDQGPLRAYDVESETESELQAPSVSGVSVRPSWVNQSTIAHSEVGSVKPRWLFDNEDTKWRQPSWIPRGDSVLPSLSDEDYHEVPGGSNGKRPRAAGKPVGKSPGAGGEVDGSDKRLSGWTGRGRVFTPARDDEHPQNTTWVKVDRKLFEALDDREYHLATEAASRAGASPVGTMGGESTSENAERPRSEMGDPSSGHRVKERTVRRKLEGTVPEDGIPSLAGVEEPHGSHDRGLKDLIARTDQKEARRRKEKANKKCAGRMSSSSPNPRTDKRAPDSGQPVRQSSSQVTAEVPGKSVRRTKHPDVRKRPLAPNAPRMQDAPASPDTTKYTPALQYVRPALASGSVGNDVPLVSPGTIHRCNAAFPFPQSPSTLKYGVRSGATPKAKARLSRSRETKSRNVKIPPAEAVGIPPMTTSRSAEGKNLTGGTPKDYRGSTMQTPVGGAMWRSSPGRTNYIAEIHVTPAKIITISPNEKSGQSGSKHAHSTRKKTRGVELPSKDVRSRGSWESGSTSSTGSTKKDGKGYNSPSPDGLRPGGGQVPEVAGEGNTIKAPKSRSPAPLVRRQIRNSKGPSKTTQPPSSPKLDKKDTEAVGKKKHPPHARVSEQELEVVAWASGGVGKSSWPTNVVCPISKPIGKAPRGARPQVWHGTPAFRNNYSKQPSRGAPMERVPEVEEPSTAVDTPRAPLLRTKSADPAVGPRRDSPKGPEKIKRALTTGSDLEYEVERPSRLPSATSDVNSDVPIEVEQGSPVRPEFSGTRELLAVAGPDDEAAKWGKEASATGWLRPIMTKERLLMRENSNRSRRSGSQRLVRSSSMDEGSILSFHARPIFSPDRYNAGAGALSWVGSLDDSCCGDSVRSFVTGGTRHSSSTSLVSGRAPSDRKMNAPQLTEKDKRAVQRLRIERASVNFPYRPVPGSQTVYKAELNGKMRAAKVINILGLSKEVATEVLEIFDAELLALTRLDSPNIVKVYGAAISPADIIVVSEFVEAGSLRAMLDDRRARLTTRMRLAIAQDIAAGMGYLYANGMQHRHLSSSSVLLTRDWRAKIIGVGMSMTTEMLSFLSEESDADDEVEGLPWASREELASAGFSQKSDVYSFGIVLWEIMQSDGSRPYAGLLPEQIVSAKYAGRGPSIPRNCPAVISNLMERCWSKLPADRPTFESITSILENADLGN